MSFHELTAKVRSLARSGKESEAMDRANQIAEDYPREPESWMLRGYLNELAGNLESAISDVERAMALGTAGPREFYTRGRYHFQAGHDSAAVEDYTTAINLCDSLSDDYFRTALHFERAEAYIRLGKKAEALEDAHRVPDDSRWWTFELRTKHDLIRDCTR
jgi:tetratricopeptide (TPR) repeat protein